MVSKVAERSRRQMHCRRHYKIKRECNEEANCMNLCIGLYGSYLVVKILNVTENSFCVECAC